MACVSKRQMDNTINLPAIRCYIITRKNIVVDGVIISSWTKIIIYIVAFYF